MFGDIPISIMFAAAGAGAAVASAATTIIVFWLNRGRAEAESKKDAQTAREFALNALHTSEAAVAKYEVLQLQFGNYKVEVARELAHTAALAEDTARALVASETRLADAIKSMGDRFDAMTTRIDSVMSRRSAKA